ncbi:MAG TPA: YbhB/YbcL family Raf kinase inhibitor-like protein [Gemmatimonadaceae bacterium]
MNRRIAVISASVALVAAASSLSAQQPPVAVEPGAAMLASVTIPAKGNAKLTVSSPAFANGADIPFENTQYKGNVFPGLSWSAGPSGTKAYVVIMQDPDAMRNGGPILHWTMFNVPASVTKLDAAMAAPPAGAQYGPNIRGSNMAYMGPHTPAGPKHRYHIQLFALDTVLALDGTATYDALTNAMKDHVLASGQLVGLGSAPPAP